MNILFIRKTIKRNFYQIIYLIYLLFPECSSASIFNMQKDTSFYTKDVRWHFGAIEFTEDTKYFLDYLVNYSTQKKCKTLHITIMEHINKEKSSILIYRRAKYIEDYLKLTYKKISDLSIIVDAKSIDGEQDIDFNIIGISKEDIIHKLNNHLPIILVSLNFTQ